MGNPDISKLGKKFSKDYQPKKNGAKPSKLKKFIKENDISSMDISHVIKNVIFEKDEDELKKLLDDQKQPMLIRLFITAFLDDFKRGKMDNINKLMDRAIGQTVQKVESENKHEVKQDLTYTEKIEKAKLLSKELGIDGANKTRRKKSAK